MMQPNFDRPTEVSRVEGGSLEGRESAVLESFTNASKRLGENMSKLQELLQGVKLDLLNDEEKVAFQTYEEKINRRRVSKDAIQAGVASNQLGNMFISLAQGFGVSSGVVPAAMIMANNPNYVSEGGAILSGFALSYVAYALNTAIDMYRKRGTEEESLKRAEEAKLKREAFEANMISSTN